MALLSTELSVYARIVPRVVSLALITGQVKELNVHHVSLVRLLIKTLDVADLLVHHGCSIISRQRLAESALLINHTRSRQENASHVQMAAKIVSQGQAINISLPALLAAVDM